MSEKIETPKLRTLVGFDSDGFTDGVAFEVAPGRFLWADSRAQAEKWAEAGQVGWSLPSITAYRTTDIETGEEVTA